MSVDCMLYIYIGIKSGEGCSIRSTQWLDRLVQGNSGPSNSCDVGSNEDGDKANEVKMGGCIIVIIDEVVIV